MMYDNFVPVREHSSKYYNDCKSGHTAGRARGIDLIDAVALERFQSLSARDGDSAEDSGSELSSSSYEHLDSRFPGAAELGEELRLTNTTPCFSDSQSLVSVTPDTDSLSATSTSSFSVTDVEDSLSDAPSMYDNADARSQTGTRLRAGGNDLVEPERRQNENRRVANEQALRAEDRDNDDEYRQRFGGREIAMIRMLELELLTADLSRQMLSMNKMMRLLSCETSHLANIIGDGRRHSIDIVSSQAARQHRHRNSDLVESSSDNEDRRDYELMMAAMASQGEAKVTAQTALLSEVVGELKSVSLIMSNTLQSVTASRCSTGSVLTGDNRAARNTDDRVGAPPITPLGDFYQVRTTSSHNTHVLPVYPLLQLQPMMIMIMTITVKRWHLYMTQVSVWFIWLVHLVKQRVLLSVVRCILM